MRMHLSLLLLRLWALCNAVLVSSATAEDEPRYHRVLLRDGVGKPRFVEGYLGRVNSNSDFPQQFKSAAKQEFKNILADVYGFSNTRDKIQFGRQAKFKDEHGKSHVRFQQTIDGLVVEGGSLMMHIEANGTVSSMNGEFVNVEDVDSDIQLDCEQAMAVSVAKRGIGGFTWLTECELSVVMGTDGQGYKAWKRTMGYQPAGDPYQQDVLYAWIKDGSLVAIRPLVYGARSLQTYHCNSGTACSTLISNSPNPIATGDAAIDAAHNNAIKTYNYYMKYFQRDSINGLGMTLKSRAHYKVNENNAYWTSNPSNHMTYGDGDGQTFIPLCLAIDVVAHELTHGVTEYESNLVYSGESGALNEAMSDIFGACVKREYGSNETFTWLAGSDVFTPGTQGDGLRNMAFPSSISPSTDYYPYRYTGSEDGGGVHWNSGIMNLAFVLLVKGGAHPRPNLATSTGIVVPRVGTSFDAAMATAAKIFYEANSYCLTSSSRFLQARLCTIDKARAYGYETNVAAAWDAVGVFDPSVPPPTPPAATVLQNNQEITAIAGASGSYKYYTLSDVPAGVLVTCYVVDGGAGDPDLYLSFGYVPDRDVGTFQCRSWTAGNEACTLSSGQTDDLYALIHGYSTYESASIRCVYANQAAQPTQRPTKAPVTTKAPTKAPTKTPVRAPTKAPTCPSTCTSRSQCCGNRTCDLNACKTCLLNSKSCKRATQCCSGVCRSGKCRAS